MTTAAVLLGVALGDALGLPCEGLSADAIAHRFGRVDRFHLLGRTGFVSDDAEQAALVAECLAWHPDDPTACARRFRRELLAWTLRLPWGSGASSLRAALRVALGMRESGVPSAGNGAAMRAAVIGARFRDDAEKRRAFGVALARTTHTDVRAVEGALFVADLVAVGHLEARRAVGDHDLAASLDQASSLAGRGATTPEAARALGTSGYVVSSVSLALFSYLRFGHDSLLALQEAISAGGDTDSIAAILGGWLGAKHGEAGLPAHLVSSLAGGFAGPTHMRALARSLDSGAPPPRFSRVGAFARNLALWPVVLFHAALLRPLWWARKVARQP